MTTPTRKSGIGTTPKEGGLPLYILVYFADHMAVAHCLNYNLVCVEREITDAVKGLFELLPGHIDDIVKLGDKAAPVKCAPERFWKAYVDGAELPVTVGPVNLRFLKWPEKHLLPEPPQAFRVQKTTAAYIVRTPRTETEFA